MHILFIADNFFPESNALANRLFDHARVWVKAGCEVSIITCVPNFPQGKVHSGYKNRWRQIEWLEGIRVVRIKSYVAQNKGTIKRLIDYLSFGLNAFLQGLFEKNIDVVIGSSPQPFAAIAARFVAYLKNKPFIFELRDFWPQSIHAVGAIQSQSIKFTLFSGLMKQTYKAAALIIVVTDSFKYKLINEFNIDPKMIVVFKNGISLSEITPNIDRLHIRKKLNIPAYQFLVGYVGTIGMAHAIEVILSAAEQQQDSTVHYLIMGAGAHACHIRQQCRYMNNVSFVPGGSRQDAINHINALDAAIVHLRKTPLFKTVIPSKIFEIMALGVPILMGVEGESRKIVVNDARAGLEFTPEDPVQLNSAIDNLRGQSYDANAVRQFVVKYYNREKIAHAMLTTIKQII